MLSGMYVTHVEAFFLKASTFVLFLPNGDVVNKFHWSILYVSRGSELKTSADLMLDL